MKLRDDMHFGEHCGPEGTLERAQWLMRQLPNGPWEWNGYKNDVYLCTHQRGQTYLMGAKRSGMRGAQFTFQYFAKPNGDEWGIVPNPYPKSVIVAGNGGPYVCRAKHDQDTIIEIDSPLAQIIKMIPELVERLEQLTPTKEGLELFADGLTDLELEDHIETPSDQLGRELLNCLLAERNGRRHSGKWSIED